MLPLLRSLILALACAAALASVPWLSAAQRSSQAVGTAAAGRTATGETPMPGDRLPDLQIGPLRDFRVQILDARRVLRFTAALVNQGDGPLEVIGMRTSTSSRRMSVVQHVYRGPDSYRSVGTGAAMYYAQRDGHNHWHVDRAAEYKLRPVGEGSWRAGRKEGFCLIDDTRISGNAPGPYDACGEGEPQDRRITEGISVGWSDPYVYDVWGQWLDLTGLPLPGRYCVMATADPHNYFLEKSDNNNAATALVDLRSNSATLIGTRC